MLRTSYGMKMLD